MRKPKPKFTVILRYPDYFTDTYPDDVYWGTASADNWPDAVQKVQRRVQKLYPDGINDHEDLALLAVIEGTPWMHVPISR